MNLQDVQKLLLDSDEFKINEGLKLEKYLIENDTGLLKDSLLFWNNCRKMAKTLARDFNDNIVFKHQKYFSDEDKVKILNYLGSFKLEF